MEGPLRIGDALGESRNRAVKKAFRAIFINCKKN